MNIKKSLRKCYNLLFETSEGYIDNLRRLGAKIGEDCTFYFPDRCLVDTSAPHLVTIGDHVKITGPSTILTHDYSWSVIKGKTGEILGNQKPVTIGNNVFIGWGATILCGTTIEDNVIIGAHAVVSGRVEHDSVWGGCPLGASARWSTTARSAQPLRSERRRTSCGATANASGAIPSRRRCASIFSSGLTPTTSMTLIVSRWGSWVPLRRAKRLSLRQGLLGASRNSLPVATI